MRRLFLQTLIGAAFVLPLGSQSLAQSTLSVGDVYVTGFNSNAPDGFAFVLLRDIAAGTDIRFTDNGFLGTGSANASSNARGGENFLRWVAPTGGLTAGTVVTYTNSTGTMGFVSAGNLPSITGSTSGLNGLSSGGDQIFIYQGTGAGTSTSTMDFVANSNPTTFNGTILNGLTFQGDGSATSWLTTGTATANTSYLPTQLNSLRGNTALAASATRGNYSGVRTGLTASAFGHAISNSANWTTASGTGTVTLTPTNFTVATSASLHWDGNGTTTGNGGSGTWDTSTQSRFKNAVSGTTFLSWVNSSAGNDHIAVFGGTAGTVSVAASGVTASGLDFQTTGYAVNSNVITLVGTAPTINAEASVSASIGSVLAGSTGLTKTGAGTLSLSAANTYTGGTTVQSGTLQLSGGSNRLSTTGAIAVSGGALDLGTHSQLTSGNVQLTGGAINNGTLEKSAGFFDVQSGSASAALTGSAGLAKSGTGTVTLTGANAYTGTTTVNAGTLLVNGTHTGGGTYTVNANGTLGGSGAITADVNLVGGTLSAGNSIGTMNINGNLTFDSSSKLFVEFNSSTLSADMLTVSGTVNLGNAFLDLNDLASAVTPIGSSFTFLTAASVNGQFSNFADGAVTNIGSNQWRISYGATSISFASVPEPSSLALIGLLGLGGFTYRRLRNKKNRLPEIVG